MKSRSSNLKRSVQTAAIALALMMPGYPHEAAAKDGAKVRVPLESTGVDPGAAGVVRVRVATRSRLTVRASGLTPATTYDLVVGGISRSSISSDANGKASTTLKTSSSDPSRELEFDPRGQELELRHGVDTVLHSVVSGSGEPAGGVVNERTSLAPTALAPGGKATARYRLRPDGRASFKVEIENLATGSYGLFVDGTLRAAIAIGPTGKGEVEFDSEDGAPKLPLDFDPRGLQIDIAQGTDVFFSGPMLAQAPGVTACVFAESEQLLDSTGVDADGKAEGRLRTRDDCDRDFRVEIEDVPVGSYELFVGGTLRGSIDVVDTGAETKGEVEFSTDPDDSGELLFDFDPVGATVEVRQGATVFFTDTFDGTSSTPTTCTPAETSEALTSTGTDPDASGDARLRLRDDCEQDFRVQIEDIADGSYDLLVGGVSRATITVTLGQGEIEFDTNPENPGEVLLDFNPSGAVIEVRQGASAFFSHTFGGGSSGPGICDLADSELPLLNSGAVGSAKGKARFRQEDDCQRDFRVEIEDLPLGDYTLRVAGIDRGTITVADNSGEHQGEIEFDTSPGPGEFLLDFDPRGALVEVAQGATVFLSRDFPTE